MTERRTGIPDDPWSGLPVDWHPDRRFDGADTGCGDLLLDLRIFFRPLAAGTRVAILAKDEGSPVEIPAWCRVTGHRLLAAAYPYYLAVVREDHGKERHHE